MKNEVTNDEWILVLYVLSYNSNELQSRLIHTFECNLYELTGEKYRREISREYICQLYMIQGSFHLLLQQLGLLNSIQFNPFSMASPTSSNR